MSQRHRTAAAVVTGASGGIGGAVADQLAAAGARVIACGRSEAPLRTLADRYPGRVSVFTGDLAEDERRGALAALAGEAGVNLLVNAAGVSSFGRFSKLADGDLARHVTVNLVVPMALTRALLPVLGRRGDGAVVNVGSTFSRLGFPGFAAYSASKAGLRGFSEALRRELSGGNVQVLHFSPRATRTRFNDARVDALNAALSTAVDEPTDVARALLRALTRGAHDVQYGWPEKLFVRVNQLFPALVDNALRRKLSRVEAAVTDSNRPKEAIR